MQMVNVNDSIPFSQLNESEFRDFIESSNLNLGKHEMNKLRNLLNLLLTIGICGYSQIMLMNVQ